MRENSKFLAKLITAALFASLILLTGCGGGGGTTTTTTPGNGTISGTAIKGPVSGAAITAFGMNSDGTKGGQIGTTTTDAQGNFSMDVGNHSGSIMLQMTGGSYIDEATGTAMTMGVGDMMTAVVPSMTAGENVTNIQMTPLTSMAQTMAQNMAGGMTQANITQANSLMGQYFGVNGTAYSSYGPIGKWLGSCFYPGPKELRHDNSGHVAVRQDDWNA